MSPRPPLNPRPWYWDALAALAFFGQALFLGKMATRALGPFGGFFVFAVNAGLGYYFARGAWRALLAGREGRR